MHGPTCIFWANLTPFSLQAHFGAVVGRYRKAVVAQTDERVRMMNEVLGGVRTIKVSAITRTYPLVKHSERYGL